MNISKGWIARQSKSNESRRAYERERLSMWTLDDVSAAMEKNGISKADLARTLGTSRAHITQVLSGSRNITLGTLADLAWACGLRANVRFQPLREGEFISSPVMLIDPTPRPVVDMAAGAWTEASVEPDLELICANG